MVASTRTRVGLGQCSGLSGGDGQARARWFRASHRQVVGTSCIRDRANDTLVASFVALSESPYVDRLGRSAGQPVGGLRAL